VTRTLVTGSAGFLASHLLPLLGGTVLGIDLAKGEDICSQRTAETIRAFDPEVVYHLAALHFVPWCREHPEETIRTNVEGTQRVLGSCGTSLRTFVLASSAAVYGFADTRRSETHPVRPVDVYGRSKVLAERAVMHERLGHPGARLVLARLFNIIGKGDATAHVLPEIIAGTTDGHILSLGNIDTRRDYVHADDAAEALLFLSEHARSGYSTWNVGTGLPTSVRELISEVGKVLGDSPAFTIDKAKVRYEDGDLYADPDALNGFGWHPRRTIGDAIKDMLA
jgi:UDP-glucose 4-epimerase